MTTIDNEHSSIVSPNIFSMFTRYKFRTHRITGGIYLLYYTYLWYWFVTDIESYINSSLTILLPSLGVLQTIIAMRTFTFLPRNKDNSGKQGYFSDKHTMSYDFLCENIFFSGILLFQWIYYSRDIKFHYIIENIMVFLPYVLLRPFTPKTSFRSSISNKNENSSVNSKFMLYVTNITKIFYVFAKHNLGFYLNYLMFLGVVSEIERYYVHLMLLFAAFATTIAMFLHTLKFKKYISARCSMTIYVASYLCTIYSLVHILMLANINIEYIILGGVCINFLPSRYQTLYQLGVMVYLNLIRYNYIPDEYNVLKIT